jgi:hypothetical protein
MPPKPELVSRVLSRHNRDKQGEAAPQFAGLRRSDRLIFGASEGRSHAIEHRSLAMKNRGEPK